MSILNNVRNAFLRAPCQFKKRIYRKDGVLLNNWIKANILLSKYFPEL
jgi:hypothetical protein